MLRIFPMFLTTGCYWIKNSSASSKICIGILETAIAWNICASYEPAVIFFFFQDVFPSCFTDCTGEEQAGNFSFRFFTGVKQQDFPRRSFHNVQMKIKQVTVTKFISALLLQGKLHYFKTSNSNAVRRFYRTLIGKPVTLNTFI